MFGKHLKVTNQIRLLALVSKTFESNELNRTASIGFEKMIRLR